MQLYNQISHHLIKAWFDVIVHCHAKLYNMQPYKQKVIALHNLPAGSLGKEIALCLQLHNLTLIPGYESHDMKHVLLGYDMTGIDEIRMQAFMLGNGNYSFACLSFIAIGLPLMPHYWLRLYADYQKGKRCIPISHWQIEDYATVPLIDLQLQLFGNK
jgi:hypothetical protein